MEIAECPQCGATTSPSLRRCAYCKAEFFVTSLAYLGSFNGSEVARYLKHYREITRQDPDNEEGLLGLGLCYLQMGTFALAEKCFERIIAVWPGQSQAYYYFGLASIKGRRIKTISLNEARRIEAYLRTAIEIGDGAPHFKLLLAMLKRDYYETNGMKVPAPTAIELMTEIRGEPIHQNELKRLKECVRVADEGLFLSDLTVTSA